MVMRRRVLDIRPLAILAACGVVASCSDPAHGPPPVESQTGIDGSTHEVEDVDAPGAETTGESSTTDHDPSDTDASHSTAPGSDGSEDATTDASGAATTSADGETGTSGTTAALSTTDDTSGESTSTSSDGTPTTTSTNAVGDESGEDGGTDVSAFPEPGTFGDDVQELDLVGTWGLNWDPSVGADSVLDIDASGAFVWSESSADCSKTTLATGVLWVEATQVVLHVDTWERPLPWDTEAILGETFPPPFRMRMSFSLQGGGVDAYLALAAPSRATQHAPYTGESYIRVAQQGVHLGGTWHGESELLAIRDGELEPVVIVRDYYDAFLDPESAPDDPQGTGTRAVTTQYFPVPHAESVYDGANWTCLGGCPQPAGTTLVDGSNLYTYGPYAGQTHLMPLADDRVFRRDVGSDCP